MATRIVHPRRSNEAKMLGKIEDAARAIARSDVQSHPLYDDVLVAQVDDLLGWDVSGNDEEAALAAEAYSAERSLIISGAAT